MTFPSKRCSDLNKISKPVLSWLILYAVFHDHTIDIISKRQQKLQRSDITAEVLHRSVFNLHYFKVMLLFEGEISVKFHVHKKSYSTLWVQVRLSLVIRTQHRVVACFCTSSNWFLALVALDLNLTPNVGFVFLVCRQKTTLKEITKICYFNSATTFTFNCIKLLRHPIFSNKEKNHYLRTHQSFYRSVRMKLHLPKKTPHP